MKTALITLGGLCAAAAGFIVLTRRQQQALPELAHQLEEAWADHHTTA
jgi:hypothetical protein